VLPVTTAKKKRHECSRRTRHPTGLNSPEIRTRIKRGIQFRSCGFVQFGSVNKYLISGINSKRIRLEDGRYLIYYTFDLETSDLRESLDPPASDDPE